MTGRTETRQASAGVDPQSAHEAVAWLTQLMSEDSSREDREGWQRWLDSSPEHQRAWQHIEAFSSRFSLLNGSAAQHSLSTLPDPQRRHLLRSLAGVGVGILGVTALGAGTLPWRPWLADYHTATGQQLPLTLEEGTRLLLNTQTALNVALPQLTLLQGEMLVTSPPAGAALQISLPQGSMQAHNGRFGVRIWQDYSDIAVYRGSVRLHPTAGGQTMKVSAGYGIRFSAAGYSAAHRVDAEPGWQQGVLFADNMRLDDFIAELSRYRHGIVRCSPQVAGLRLSGTFPLSEAEEIITALPGTLPVQVRSVSPYFIMLS